MTRLPHAPTERVTFRWEGRAIEGRAGDTVAAALHAVGVRTLTRSRKFHRPRGLSGSHAAGALARVNGQPNIRLDLEPLAEGMDTRAQNVWPSLRFDLLAAARFMRRRWLRGGFEHPRLLRSGTRTFGWWERLLGFMAGGATPPTAADPREPPAGRRLRADVVVIGGGPAGRTAANEAAGAGARVMLVAGGADPGRFARASGEVPPDLTAAVTLLADTQAFALYRGGTLVACAPRDRRAPATVIDAGRVVLATGRRSWPPLVPGADLPGVLDLHTALSLAHDHGVAPGARVAIIGTGAEVAAAARLGELGVNIVAAAPVATLRRIHGRRAVTGVELDGVVSCDSLVHAGPWRTDPSLRFQAGADGAFRLEAGEPAIPVEAVGAAAVPDEPTSAGAALSPDAIICPCMDVTVAEVRDLVATDIASIEVVKRMTGCGMGPCQGVPCWDMLALALAEATGGAAEFFGHPSYRAPRAALTVAQAAGLDRIVEPQP
jgi:NADPH-dependent 2,4-dienoyl-CoA reductase/sulfur reductase-like enzyme/bacterioferritin-associated ferredoxin